MVWVENARIATKASPKWYVLLTLASLTVLVYLFYLSTSPAGFFGSRPSASEWKFLELFPSNSSEASALTRGTHAVKRPLQSTEAAASLATTQASIIKSSFYTTKPSSPLARKKLPLTTTIIMATTPATTTIIVATTPATTTIIVATTPATTTIIVATTPATTTTTLATTPATTTTTVATTPATTTTTMATTPATTTTIVATTPATTNTLVITPTTTTEKATLGASRCGQWVVFSDDLRDGRGLGNQIFTMVAGLMVAQLTLRRVVMNSTLLNRTDLETIFTHHYERVSEVCQRHQLKDRWNLAYNPEVETYLNSNSSKFLDLRQKSGNSTIVMNGFFQSWRYALNEHLLRTKYLIINDKYANDTERYFESVRPKSWAPFTYTRVGVHVRRGDVLTEHSVNFGYTTPKVGYFKKAMNTMWKLFKKVQFVIVSNDEQWCLENLVKKDLQLPREQIDVVLHSHFDQFKDFAVLASCHHTIMSTGTYGWWAAYLNKGTTIYYKDWPKKESKLDNIFKKEDFFPPSWIGESD